MPILNDINDHEVLKREYKRGLQFGVQQGGRQGALSILLNQIESRFGAIPSSARGRISALSPADPESLSMNLLRASTLSALLETL